MTESSFKGMKLTLLGVSTAIRDARGHTQASDKASLGLTKKTRVEREVYELRQAVRALTQAVEGVYEDALTHVTIPTEAVRREDIDRIADSLATEGKDDA